ncbi:5-carboxymethyl-2-hydroxymuconate isomerase [Streptomyces sp. B4I13]|uniref:5-carboxymethyl-2-hydroxymuconate isomerase n=1 Tax=Streptomyces achromogenes TaxID=67255 RepID=A0ABU0PY49_STRAH|nr:MULTISPECIES: isomerase [Streptomyces]MDQ0683333.1 5-carboxymethyl-2-hydroxymuconate isomerase [Streptomyces achromogenes]MDQ0830534.1 5-carboxymethyl-2-hydroxymuconate isomerase [Streptomyces achromogenes]MDQ0962358.1 5-carboxymethyl-2-hydroxymuconate isomerase [Streptomyces sp. B4I13]
MPQITVDYSSTMDPAFDRAGFARALHASVVEIAAAKPEACKTLFRPAEFTAFGYDDPEERGHAVVHVTLGLLAGRTDETKTKLTETVLELLRAHVADGGFVLHASAEVRDLDPSYRKYES